MERDSCDDASLDKLVALVIMRTKSSGTHRGVFMGIAPGNKPVSWPGVNVLEVRDGRIASS